MQIKFKDTTYKISFTFLASILYVLTVNKSQTLSFVLLFSILHEMIHLIFIYCFSVAPRMVSFNFLGANIKRGITTSYKINSEIIINASAPVFNLFTGVIFYLLSRFFSYYDVIFTEIANVNFVLGFFNLIPFYSFDGGNTLKYILLKYVNEEITERTLTVVSLLVTVTFSFISIHIFLNYKHNFSLIIMSIYMFLSIIFKKENSLDY